MAGSRPRKKLQHSWVMGNSPDSPAPQEALDRAVSNLINDALREALDAVATPIIRESIITRALERMGRQDIPATGEELARFFSTPLRQSITEALGTDCADSIVAQLTPIVSRVSVPANVDDERARRRAEDDTARTLRPNSRIVLVASFDPELPRLLAKETGTRARIIGMEDVFALVQAAKAHAVDQPMLLVDCRTDGLRTATIASLVAVLRRGSRVLLWGLDEKGMEELRILKDSITWVPIGKEASVEEVAWLCGLPIQMDTGADPVKLPILIVDDDRTYLKSQARLVAATGVTVLTATSGEEALAVCAKQRPALVLTDLNMPGMSGVQFSNALRIFYANEAPPLVLITASQQDDLDIDPFERVLRKPVGPQELLDMIRELAPD